VLVSSDLLRSTIFLCMTLHSSMVSFLILWDGRVDMLLLAPQFHLFLDNCQNGEVYNTIIYGAFEGGLDAIDVSGTNIHIHDVEVSNKDECVTIKVFSCCG
jgi:hypothetical protein